MKWWYWLILELLIIFGVMAWVYFFPSEDIYDDFGKGLIGSVLFCCVEEIRKRMGENYTVEQNAGENQNEWHYPSKGEYPKDNSFVKEELEKENAELKKDRDYFSGALDKQVEATLELQKKYQDLMEQNDKAKELIKNIIRVTWGEGWNYSLDWKVKAEQFLKEVE